MLRALAVAGAIAASGFPMWHSVYEWRAVARDVDACAAALADAPPGSVAVVPPLRRTHETPYSIGEDLQRAAVRDRVATVVYGLRAIRIAPALRTVEPTPPLQLAARGVALPWLSGDLATAREQLAAAARAAGASDARLVAVGLAVPGRAGEGRRRTLRRRARRRADRRAGRAAAVRRRRARPAAARDDRGARRGVGDPARRRRRRGYSPRRLAAADDDGAYHLVRAHGVSTAIVTCDASGCALAGVAWAD